MEGGGEVKKDPVKAALRSFLVVVWFIAMIFFIIYAIKGKVTDMWVAWAFIWQSAWGIKVLSEPKND